MSTGIDRLAEQLQKTITEKDNNKKTGYDTQAEVVKVDDDVIWVKIPGGVDETPVAKTTSAKPGDAVQVRVSGGRAWVVGNYTSPPTDDARANAAYILADDANENATIAKSAAESALQDADIARAAAESAQADAESAHAAATQAQTDANQAKADAQAASTAATQATATANSVRGIAEQAQADASQASTAASQAQSAASSASALATQAQADANQAKADAQSASTAASQAQVSANNANEYAARALGNLSTVQSVSETLAWITEHGTMTLTTDTALNPSHVYFVVDSNGDYEIGGTRYSVVTEPNVADIGTYYELDIDESLNNYVGTHLSVTGEGLWILPSSSGGSKVLIATGNGTTYTEAGTYIIDEAGATAAYFGSDGSIIGKIEESHIYQDFNSWHMVDKEGGTYVNIEDMRGNDGYVDIIDTFVGDGTQTAYQTTIKISHGGIEQIPDPIITVNDVPQSDNIEIESGFDWSIVHFYALTTDTEIISTKKYYTRHEQPNIWHNFVRVNNPVASDLSTYYEETPLSDGDVLVISYKSDSSNAKAFTFGIRKALSNIGAYSFCVGFNCDASGGYSFAKGYMTTASGNSAHAEGAETTASGLYSHAEGYRSIASGSGAHAEGERTLASGNESHATGSYSQATGFASHAEGGETVASGEYAHAEGFSTEASALYSHAEGRDSIASAYASHAEGRDTIASSSDSHAEGYKTTASGMRSHAEGDETTAQGRSSHAEGQETTASGNDSHAEGVRTTADGHASHAEGYETWAGSRTEAVRGSGAHAEGLGTIAEGNESHAEGYQTWAFGDCSHAQNRGTKALHDSQTVIGKYNDNNSNNAFEIGNGSDDNNRSNAFAVAWNGDVNIASGAKYKINGSALAASDVNAVPTTRKVNNKALSTDISLDASDVGALPSSTAIPSNTSDLNNDSGFITASGILDLFYPVGSYYETSDANFDPNTAWGGTWSLESGGLVHIGADSNYTIGDTGGNKDAIIPYHRHSYTAPPSNTGSHTLTLDEIPSHSHSFTYAQYGRGAGTATASALQYSGSTKTTDSKGGGKGHSHTISGSSSNTGYAGASGNLTDANMQPYVVVNRWHRTA